MSDKIDITITTKIKYTDNTEENFKNLYEGVIYNKSNEYYIRYQETIEQNLGNTWAIIKWKKKSDLNKIVIIRQGDIKANQTFSKGRKDISNYHNVNGDFEIEIDTNDVIIEISSDDNGIINLDYQMTINSQLIGNYYLEINYSKKTI